MNTENTNSSDSSSFAVPLLDVAVRLHPQDDVAIAKINLQTNTTLVLGTEEHPHTPTPSHSHTQIRTRQPIPSGHKMALREIATGEPVRRYSQVIGFASQPILPGEHVHTHNLDAQDFAREYAFGLDAQPMTFAPESERRTNRVVIFLSDAEVALVDQSRGRDKRGPFCRGCVLEKAAGGGT